MCKRRRSHAIPSHSNLDGCRLTLQEISDQGLAELLPDTAPDGITAPAQRYLELREAILNS